MRNDLPQATLRDTKFAVAFDKFDPRNLFRSSPEGGDLFQSDQSNIQEYFRKFHKVEVQCIATDRFLNKSKDEYSAPWLTREIVQNFVDHNPNQGTLDGVNFKEENTANGRRFTIEGNWEFRDPTGLTALHSDKPTDFETAGGNGIGIKQTTIRFLRDFGVKTFIIQGNGWDVEYQLVRRDDIINDWRRREPARWRDKSPLISHDWLIAKIKKAPVRTDKCAYIIESNDPDATAALRQLSSLGVSSENPFLKDSDYVSPEHGQIKWLRSADEKGRLFVNGQVMQYREKGTPDDFWRGTEGVSIAVKNIKYRMSIDRPPVTKWDLNTYLHDVVAGMSKDEIIAQLKASEHLWPGAVRADEEAFNVLLERLTFELMWRSDFKKDQYSGLFSGRKYLYKDRGITDSQIEDVKAQGYIICPGYFERIGMPPASSRLSSLEQAINKKPDVSAIERNRQTEAEKIGVLVKFQQIAEIKEIKSPEDFFGLMLDRLKDELISIDELPKKFLARNNKFRIKLKTQIPKELLSVELYKRETEIERLVYFLRGVIHYGLSEKIFESVFLTQGDYVSTYDLSLMGEYLPVLLTKSPNNLGTVLEFEVDAKNAEILRNLLSPPVEAVNPQTVQPPASQEAKVEEPKTITKEEGTAQETQDQLEKLGEIPIPQPPPPEVKVNQRVIKKTIEGSDQSEKYKQMERQIPGLRKAVEALGERPSEGKNKESNEQKIEQIVKKTAEWASGNFENVKKETGYLTGRSLVEIILENSEANIGVVEVEKKQYIPTEAEKQTEREFSELNKRLQGVVNANKEPDETVDEFEIVLEPNDIQSAQLALLKDFLETTTGIVIPKGRLFIYKGTGSKGVNVGKRFIGINEEMLKISFNEAEGTFAHEAAHIWEMDHNVPFIRALQSVTSSEKRKMLGIIEKQARGEQLNGDEVAIVNIQKTWNSLKSQG